MVVPLKLMPVVQPFELKQTGRSEKMGPELLRFTDRHSRPFVLSPTAEEVNEPST